MKQILNKIQNKWIKLRLQPIRVYCLHHVCERFDAEWMNQCDWMPIDEFKRKVRALQQSGVEFVSLTEAHHHLLIASSPFAIRLKRYAVLTFDDGYASLKEVLPWLKEQGIPVTLFVNPDYAAGKSYRKTPKEQYLSIKELSELAQTPNTIHHVPLVEIGMHGLQHIDVSQMSVQDFNKYVAKSIVATSQLCGFIRFWAYTWGKHNANTDETLLRNFVVPVLINGKANYNNNNICRELF